MQDLYHQQYHSIGVLHPTRCCEALLLRAGPSERADAVTDAKEPGSFTPNPPTILTHPNTFNPKPMP